MPAKISIISVIDFSKIFEWNVEDTLELTQDFEWNAGEGPLFWWRVEFRSGACPPNVCSEGISDCTFMGPLDDICCAPIECPPDNCISTDTEIWNILATSAEHVCERLTLEKCNRKPSGFIKKLQRYQRPALCCDVEKFISDGVEIVDEFEDVDFLICECASFIDPCEQMIEFPCPPSQEVVSSIFCAPILTDLGSGFAAETFNAIEPKSFSFGKSIPELLTLEHNLSKLNLFDSFLIRNNLSIDPKIKLFYNKDLDSWQNTINLKGKEETWKLIFDASCLGEGNEFTWKINLHISKTPKLNSRVMVHFTTNDPKASGFVTNININTKTGSLTGSSLLGVHSKLIHDGIGVFKKDWLNDPFLKIKIG